ncbi:LamG-like jellyroll fold domain-containing protein [Porphyromonas gingivalis]|uniref:LamG domain-containing protein n=2 Tax=root TaxID=1 RepID=A0AAE9XA27_PORGN|nr:LamG-like jellyroll fold domain-containing protein [Porphyromonas gingivalis]WCG02567.1 LamG domain-containing protein [Porphyromonas gingivalis]SJL29019.1 hypothetical protein PGIN_ATCC49417_00822 [Porphyromonas gingivalis]
MEERDRARQQEIDESVILYFPFDEPAGSKVAYDYSATRSDVQVGTASLVTGRMGNAVRFAGNDKIATTKQVPINLSGNFTLSFFAKALSVETGAPKKFIWLLNFGGVNKYVEVEVESSASSFKHLALVKSGRLYAFYENGVKIKEHSGSDTLAGLSLNQDYYGGKYGFGLLDNVKIFNRALTQEEIMSEAHGEKSPTYSIDGVDLKEYGVFVSDSEGVMNRPKIKRTQSASWDDYHGEDVDLKHIYYEPREITLHCFITASSKVDFATKVSRFEQLFDKKGLRRLTIDVHPTKPLIYNVYCRDEIVVAKEWSDRQMVGTFKLKLIEPQPVKKILKHIYSSSDTQDCRILFSTDKLINIDWGDGVISEDVSGQMGVSHGYAKKGEYYIVITGCIEEIKKFETNAIVVWDRL